MKKCILCNKETTGSIGAAGIKWDFICQPCKDQEDQMAWNNFKAISGMLDKFFVKLENNPKSN